MPAASRTARQTTAELPTPTGDSSLRPKRGAALAWPGSHGVRSGHPLPGERISPLRCAPEDRPVRAVGAQRPAARWPYREGGELLGRHGGEQLRQQQQQRHPHPEAAAAAAAGTQRLREAEEWDSPWDVAPSSDACLAPFQSLPLGGPSLGPLLSFSPPLEIWGRVYSREAAVSPSLRVPASLLESQPQLGDAPQPSRRPPAAQALAGGSAGPRRLPRGAAPPSA